MKRTLLIALITCFTLLSAGAQERNAAGLAGIFVQVKLYPNPATSFINFELGNHSGKGYTLQVYNFMGRKMQEQANAPDRITINLTDYPRGVYIYQLRDKNGRIIESGKFQVSK